MSESKDWKFGDILRRPGWYDGKGYRWMFIGHTDNPVVVFAEPCFEARYIGVPEMRTGTLDRPLLWLERVDEA